MVPIDYITHSFSQFFAPLAPNWGEFHIILSFGIALLVAYIFNKTIARLAPAMAASITRSMESAPASERFLRTRRLETFLSLGVAIGRVVVIIGALIIAWKLSNPTTAPLAIVGASTIFVLLGGATLVPLLKDVTYGFVMIAEHWFNVGDHVVIEPFPHLGGVVEQVTLRATKLRSVNGEIIWVHNQHIQAVRVSAAASHTMAIETFVSDPELGEQIIKKAFKVIPSSPITIPKPLTISEIKQVDDDIWRITAICEVTPYREWMIERFALEAITTTDQRTGREPVIVHGPVAFYADATAERRYRRSVHGHIKRTAAPPRPGPKPQ